MMDIGHVVLVDRSKRAIAAWFELFLDRDTAQEWLELAPDVIANDLVSWGRVTPDQINSLFGPSAPIPSEPFRSLPPVVSELPVYLKIFRLEGRTDQVGVAPHVTLRDESRVEESH